VPVIRINITDENYAPIKSIVHDIDGPVKTYPVQLIPLPGQQISKLLVYVQEEFPSASFQADNIERPRPYNRIAATEHAIEKLRDQDIELNERITRLVNSVGNLSTRHRAFDEMIGKHIDNHEAFLRRLEILEARIAAYEPDPLMPPPLSGDLA
jgi:hypothetical protein